MRLPSSVIKRASLAATFRVLAAAALPSSAFYACLTSHGTAADRSVDAVDLLESALALSYFRRDVESLEPTPADPIVLYQRAPVLLPSSPPPEDGVYIASGVPVTVRELPPPEAEERIWEDKEYILVVDRMTSEEVEFQISGPFESLLVARAVVADARLTLFDCSYAYVNSSAGPNGRVIQAPGFREYSNSECTE